MIVIATSVPILVWAVSLGLEWQAFDPLQFLGFLLIVVGNLIFNDILIGNVFVIEKKRFRGRIRNFLSHNYFYLSAVFLCFWLRHTIIEIA